MHSKIILPKILSLLLHLLHWYLEADIYRTQHCSLILLRLERLCEIYPRLQHYFSSPGELLNGPYQLALLLQVFIGRIPPCVWSDIAGDGGGGFGHCDGELNISTVVLLGHVGAGLRF